MWDKRYKKDSEKIFFMLKFKYHQKLTKKNLFATMGIVTQKANFRQSVVLYSYRNSIFATIRRFGVSRATIYRWRKPQFTYGKIPSPIRKFCQKPVQTIIRTIFCYKKQNFNAYMV